MRTRHRFGLSVASPSRLSGFILALTAATGSLRMVSAQESPLPKAPAAIAASPTRIVLVLPDSGGFVINNQPVPTETLQRELTAIFGSRPSRILLVGHRAGARLEDLRRILAIAKRLGITLYDAG